jgi:hypothetical protein
MARAHDPIRRRTPAGGVAVPVPAASPWRPFDPSSVDISWDEFTGLELGNFGLVVVPEPTSALLLDPPLIVL